ncbi:hypothetical protein D3C84_1012800 [compost metagenome]
MSDHVDDSRLVVLGEDVPRRFIDCHVSEQTRGYDFVERDTVDAVTELPRAITRALDSQHRCRRINSGYVFLREGHCRRLKAAKDCSPPSIDAHILTGYTEVVDRGRAACQRITQ